MSANTSAINNANPTAHRIADQSSPVSVSTDQGRRRQPHPTSRAGERRHVTRRATRVPGGGPPTLSDRSAGLAATGRAHLIQVSRLAGNKRATRVSRRRRELDAAQGHAPGPGDTGPGAVMGVVVACAAQVPPSAPVADHPAHDDRLRGRWLALRQPHTPTSPKRASCTGRPTPVGGAHRAGPDTVGTRPPTKPGGRSSSFATHSRAIGRAWPVRGTRWWARPSSPHIPTRWDVRTDAPACQ